MSNNPAVTIIIVTKNEEDNIGRCLTSIFSQSYPLNKTQVIVVDNYSTDKTVTIAKSFPVELFSKGPERHAQRNFGTRKAKGKYLLFIDADMELENNLLKEAVTKAEKENYDAIILPERAGGKGFWVEAQKIEKRCYLNDPDMLVANRFIKKSVYRVVGGYNQKLIIGEDFDIHERIKAGGFRIGRIKSIITHYEKTNLLVMLKKKYYYGKQVPGYYRVKGKKSFTYINLLRPAYFRNWKLFACDPIHGIGLVVMKTCQWIAGGLGMIVGLVENLI